MGKFMGVNAPEGGEEPREEPEEESDSEDSDLTRGARDEVVKLALGFLRNMNQDEIAENVHSSKSLMFPPTASLTCCSILSTYAIFNV